ncbi:MAG: oligosaccharide flippase family protein [Hespellia sp.]|nr:oligosaccharide flippase family protein [Hespellia sp.]
MKKNPLMKGAALLTGISLLTRIMGFFYRIFLSRTFGEESVGLYQLIFPVFALALAFSVSGIQTALSRIVAYKIGRHDVSGARESLCLSLILSLFLSLLSMVMIQQKAVFIAEKLMSEPRCTDLLIIMTYAIPFAAIHSCISGYYYGLKQTAVPAVSQLLEQIFRISCVYFLYRVSVAEHLKADIAFAVAGIVIGEVASSACTIISLKTSQNIRIFGQHHSQSLSSVFCNLKELTLLSAPLSGNRIILTVLQSVEAVSIPIQLQTAHYSVSEALSIYGVLTGMSLPCIMFPSVITNSVSVLLTPTVAGIQSAAKEKQLSRIIRNTCILGFALGLFSCLFFLIFGNLIGRILFHSEMAGKFILILAWICPFLYLSTALASILNGLGKTAITFLINLVGITIRILSIFLLIPFFDLKGYLWGLLLSQIVICGALLQYLKIYIRKN